MSELVYFLLEICTVQHRPMIKLPHTQNNHSRYLEKDQLKGPSSLESYISALSQGARFLEGKSSRA